MSKSREPIRLDVRKAYALFINGVFVRSESGASDTVGAGTDEPATVARATRKDMRDAVVAARSAFGIWSALAPMQRGLALYHHAELLDARRAEFVERLRVGARLDVSDALRETTAAVDRVLWYAGWCDKYATIVSSRDPVAGPFLTLTAPRPLGVIGSLAPDEQGAGQMSRLDSARIASIKAEHAGLSLAGTVVASDAFFPFRDGLDVVVDAGATCVIQPGGSMRDDEVIAAANERGVAMVYSGVRHFRH